MNEAQIDAVDAYKMEIMDLFADPEDAATWFLINRYIVKDQYEGIASKQSPLQRRISLLDILQKVDGGFKGLLEYLHKHSRSMLADTLAAKADYQDQQLSNTAGASKSAVAGRPHEQLTEDEIQDKLEKNRNVLNDRLDVDYVVPYMATIAKASSMLLNPAYDRVAKVGLLLQQIKMYDGGHEFARALYDRQRNVYDRLFSSAAKT